MQRWDMQNSHMRVSVSCCGFSSFLAAKMVRGDKKMDWVNSTQLCIKNFARRCTCKSERGSWPRFLYMSFSFFLAMLEEKKQETEKIYRYFRNFRGEKRSVNRKIIRNAGGERESKTQLWDDLSCVCHSAFKACAWSPVYLHHGRTGEGVLHVDSCVNLG